MYEATGPGRSEQKGNAAMKDVLMNAEGAEFGIALMNDPATTLPGMCEGPVLEDRTLGKGTPYSQQQADSMGSLAGSPANTEG